MSPAILEREPITSSESEHPALVQVESLLSGPGADQRGRPRLVGPSGEEIELPEPLFQVLREAVHHLLQGDSVSIAPVHKLLTTQQAAELLNVSRPYLVRLLEAGEIPHTRTGTHRRIRLGDLLAYGRERDVQRREGLARLSRTSQKLGLYSMRTSKEQEKQ
jgi:excisionase family DNA binding protein